MIEQAEIRLNVGQLIAAIRQLSSDERELVRRELEDDSWDGLEALLARVRGRFEQNPMNEEEINAEIELARQEFYDQSHS